MLNDLADDVHGGGAQYVVFPEDGSSITEELISPCRKGRIHRTYHTPCDADPSSIVLTGSRAAV